AVRLWDVATATERTFGGHRGAVTAVVFSPDGKTLATAGWDQTVRLWDAQSGAERKVLYQGPESSARQTPPALVFSPDGNRLAAALCDGVRIWDLQGREVLRARIDLPGKQVLAFSADGASLGVLTFGTGDLRWLDASTGRETRVLAGSRGVSARALSP